ncbi:unnamed protein product [Didymodactylos carnosus]|uniref:Cupin-like domain-containing protein n=1 Tax=Didymodactylos carnosus TaxID=1234261 RepID=A0A815VSH9_9BILA|nr:unnamed protein product [Didymodactylos carnosus]CAF1539474.1 unnamed protein product [Didymodactylos carnosus]CAF3549436.1 unnamed protein product [Didymodactylos carnosus]CAF4399662.1 unnamed protein product [Didymodactylos carnosus]
MDKPPTGDDISNKIDSVIKHLKANSISLTEVEKLKSYKKLRAIIFTKSKSINHLSLFRKITFKIDIYIILSVLFGLLGLITTFLSYYGLELFINETYKHLFEIDLRHEQCLVPKLEFLLDIVRPASNCDLCRNIQNVDRINNVTREEFEEKYAYTRHPVIITDAMKNWLAVKKFNYNFFKRLYRPDSTALRSVEEVCQFFPYKNKAEFDTLADVFMMDTVRAYMLETNYKPWYVGWSNCDYSTAYLLRQYYSRPYFLPEQSESSKGTPGLGAHMHIDNVDLPSWQAQVKGRKKWTLRPAPECMLACKELNIIMQPGEIIVLDTNWWYHKTYVISEDEISITIGSEFD